MTKVDYIQPETARDEARAKGAVLNLLLMLGRVAALATIFVGFGLAVPNYAFFSASNIENILMQSAVYGMAGLGMTMIIVTGGIDLAAGSTIAMSMVSTALVLTANGGKFVEGSPVLCTLLAVIAGVATGVIVGLIQGLLITSLRVVPFIITLGGMLIVRAIAKEMADNQEISASTTNWLYRNLMLGVQGRTFSWQLFPLGVWLTIVASAMAGLFLRYTKLGRRFFAVGSNEATARLCGVPVARTKVTVYALGGCFIGLAGVLEFAKLNMGQPTGALTYELYVIAACVIGGASLTGGVGTITGTLIGALIIGTLNAGTQQVGLRKSYQEIAIGVIIIVAVALDQLRNRRRS